MLRSYQPIGRPNGSLAGDSGVASQNDERQRQRINESNSILSNRPINVTRTNYLSSHFHPRPVPSHAVSSGLRYEPSTISSRFSHISRTGDRLTNRSRNDSSSPIIVAAPENPPNFLNTKTWSNLRETNLQNSAPISDVYPRMNASRFTSSDYSPRSPQISSYRPGKSAIRDLASSGAYDSVPPARRYTQNRRDLDHLLRGTSGTESTRKPSMSNFPTTISTSSPKLGKFLRQESGDEEAQVGSIVENELERYISKIRSLHRDFEPQSLEELDHEQNTSGDLLNVTLSDDDDRAMPEELGNVLALAKDLVSRTATNDKFDDESIRPDDKDPSINPQQLNAVQPKFSLLAKSGISASVAKDVDGSPKNIVEIAKTTGNRREYAEEKISNEDIDDDNEFVKRLNGRLVNGVENSADDYFRDAVDDIEPWNISALERRVREITLDDEAHTDFVPRQSSVDDTTLDDHREKFISDLYEHEKEGETDEFVRSTDDALDENSFGKTVASQLGEEAQILTEPFDSNVSVAQPAEQSVDQLPRERSRVEENTTGNRVTENLGERGEGNYAEDQGIDPQYEYQQDSNAQYENYDTNNGQYGQDPGVQYDQQYQQYTEYPDARYSAEPNVQYNEDPNGRSTGDSNEKHSVDADARYIEDPNGVYSTDPNAQCIEDPDAQYVADPHQEYAQDPDDARHTTDPNQQYVQHSDAQYSDDSNVQYVADPNSRYADDPNERYADDSNVQYTSDPNQQYAQDSDAQYNTSDPNQQYAQNSDAQYNTSDPNQQYAQNSDAQYNTSNPNQQYAQNSNAQYNTSDPNQQYAQNSDAQYNTSDSNQQYAQDSDAQYIADDQTYQRPGDYGENPENVQDYPTSSSEAIKISEKDQEATAKKTKDVIKSLLDSDTESTIERNVSNTESDFDFN